jgi:hypothetical protein
LKELLKLYREGFSAPEKQHYELGKKIRRIAIEEQYVIGTVGLAPGIMGLRVVKNSMGMCRRGCSTGRRRCTRSSRSRRRLFTREVAKRP